MSLRIRYIDFPPISTTDKQRIEIDVVNQYMEFALLVIDCNDGFLRCVEVPYTDVYVVEKDNVIPNNRCEIKLIRCRDTECSDYEEVQKRIIRYLYSPQVELTHDSPPRAGEGIGGIITTYMASGDYQVERRVLSSRLWAHISLAVGYELELNVAFATNRPPLIANVCVGTSCTPIIHVGETGYPHFSTIQEFYCSSRFRFLCGRYPIFVTATIAGRVGMERLEGLIRLLNNRIAEFSRRTGFDFGRLDVARMPGMPFWAMFSQGEKLGSVTVGEEQFGEGKMYLVSGRGYATFVLSSFPHVKVQVVVHGNTTAFAMYVDRIATYYPTFIPAEPVVIS